MKEFTIRMRRISEEINVEVLLGTEVIGEHLVRRDAVAVALSQAMTDIAVSLFQEEL